MQFQNRDVSAPHEIGTNLQDCLCGVVSANRLLQPFRGRIQPHPHLIGMLSTQILQTAVTVGRCTSLQRLYQSNVISNLARLFFIRERLVIGFTYGPR